MDSPLKLHFIPYLAAGHMIPLCDIATLFASRGHHVTIITTPFNANILRKSIPSDHPFLQLHIIPLPSQEVGLLDGVETMTATTDITDAAKLYGAAMLLRAPIHHFMELHPADCIVADFMYPWVHDVANTLHVPRLTFSSFSLFAETAMESVKANPEIHSGTGPFVIPDFPHEITMCARPPKLLRFVESLLDPKIKSHALIVNNFKELDGEEYIEHYEKITGHKAWHLGPACLVRETAQQKAVRGQESVLSKDECLSWLDSKPSNSVVYISFGSVCRYPDEQLYEIACGVEAAGHGFVWVVPEKKGKETESEEEKEKWLPKGFEERNREKGMVIRGWAPQVLILSHPAVGAFLSHCGCNSMVEAVSAGVPMITWPVQGEQFYNEKLVTQVRGIGVEVGATEWRGTGFGERDTIVNRESVEKAVRKLMDGGDEAEEIRRRAQLFAKKAKEAIKEGGSSHKNLTALIEDLKRLRESK